jgi:hypothetical protein
MIPATAGLKVFGGSQAQSFTTSFAKATPFSTNSPANAGVGQWGCDKEGDQSVKPDLANDRLLLFSPGVYEVTCEVVVSAGGSSDVVCSLFANGVQQQELTTEFTVANSGKENGTISGILNVSRTQALTGTATVPLELWAKATAGATTVTIEYANFVAKRLE